MHLGNSSLRVFSSDLGSAFMWSIFLLSVNHTFYLHIHTNGRALEAMHHFKLGLMLLFFNSQMYFKNSVFLLCRSKGK